MSSTIPTPSSSNNTPSSSKPNSNQNNDATSTFEASFETSFADDVNGAAFKSLLKSSNGISNNDNGGSASGTTEQQVHVHLDSLQLDSSSEGDGSITSNAFFVDKKDDEGDCNIHNHHHQQQQQQPEDLNLFISDLLDQMVSFDYMDV